MTEFLFGFLFFATDLVAILLLVATWQHTRISGFLVLAATYLAGMVSRWLTPLAYRFAEADNFTFVSMAVQAVYFVVAVAAVYGLWDVYRQLKRRHAAIAPSA